MFFISCRTIATFYYLQKEEAKESVLRVQLLRERENRCALGVESNCDFFHPNYFEEDELVYDVSVISYAMQYTLSYSLTIINSPYLINIKHRVISATLRVLYTYFFDGYFDTNLSFSTLVTT